MQGQWVPGCVVTANRYDLEVNSVRIGVTSPLSGNEMPSPDIGVTRHCAILETLGVEPVILRKDMNPLNVIEQFALRGLVFSGGGDIAAGAYGGDESRIRDLDFRRDIFEFALMERALEIGLPVLAVCRGMQVANVLLGGTLIEDLRHHMGDAYKLMHDQSGEAQLPYDAYAHDVTIEPGTILHDIIGIEHIQVNSLHHQGIGELASGLRVTAQSDDNVIEAIEFAESSEAKGFFLGVQWHPEWIPADAVSQALYARLRDSGMCAHP